MRDRAAVLRPGAHAVSRVVRAALVAWLLAFSACGPDESDLPPDRRLQSELGLDPMDRVHEVVLSAGAAGTEAPGETVVLSGDYLQFVTGDSWVHEVIFESDSLASDRLAFMAGLDQMASPPLVSRGSRFVVSFVGAPEGRYPFRVEGNHAPVRGAIIVEAPTGG